MIPALRTERVDVGDGKEQSKSEANVPPVHAIPHQSNTP
jgi:hypothetical protein